MGEDDRESAVSRVREAYAEQRIAHEEMDDRLDRVLAATTHGELAVALDGLPAEDPGTAATIAAAGGRITRRGAWQVPRTLTVEGLTTGWKDLRYRPRQPSRPDAPRIRFSGAVGYGRLRIRHAWR